MLTNVRSHGNGDNNKICGDKSDGNHVIAYEADVWSVAQAALDGPLAGKAAHCFPPIDTPARHFMLRPAPADGGKTRLNFFILHSAFRFGFSVTTRDVFSFPAGGRKAPSAARGAGGTRVYTPLKYGLLFLDRVFPL